MSIMLVVDLMTTEFSTSATRDAPQRAETPVVVVNEERQPLWIVGPLGPGPIVLLPPDSPVNALSTMPGVMQLLNDGLPGVVVYDAGRFIGLIPRDAIVAHLVQAIDADGDAVGTVLDGTDYALYGEPHLEPSPIRIKCGACGAISSVAEYPPPRGVCPNGQDHLFTPGWGV